MIGVIAGSYQIVSSIGEGGMGVVYLGRHTILDRPAAIKVLLPELSQRREIVSRFFNEARAATASRHPGIVEIYDFGFLPDGAAFIAMEFLQGESLASRLRRERRLPVFATIQIGRQIAAALHAAHSKGITHRDLKPDNVFLVPDPEIGERVKLLDFGIAKLTADDAPSAHTRTGMVMGTPAYMSPEQCRGESTLDQRADLYSLGCMLYELLAGRPLFSAASAGDIIAHHLYFQPEPVRVHDSSLPAPLDHLIMALLAKDPAQRPATAGVVVEILDQWRAWNIPPSSDAALAASIASLPMAERGRISGPIPTTLSGAAASVAGLPTATPAARSRRAIRFAVTAAVAAVAGTAILVAGPPASAVQPPASAVQPPAPAVQPPAPAAQPPAQPPTAAQPAAAPPVAAAPPPEAAAEPAAASSPAAAAVPPSAAAPPRAAVAATDLVVSAPHKKPPGSKHAKAPPALPSAVQPTAPELAAAGDRAEDTPAVAPAPPPAPIPAEPAPVPAAAIPPPAPIKTGSLDAVSSIASVNVDGPLPDSEIRSTVERALGTLRECYRSAARQAGKTPALRITLSFTVDEGRAARGVQVRGDTLGIAACVKEAASKIPHARCPRRRDCGRPGRRQVPANGSLSAVRDPDRGAARRARRARGARPAGAAHRSRRRAGREPAAAPAPATAVAAARARRAGSRYGTRRPRSR